MMALASCSGLSKQAKPDIMVEDTLAHEELFGAAEGAVDLRIKKDPIPVDPLKTPKIGVQYQPKYEEGGKYYFAIRFVAAIASPNVEAYWTRGVSDKTSTEVKTVGSNANTTVTTAYERVNDNGSVKAATSEGEGYNYYVVYTLRNIPEIQADSFIAAYLTISDGVNEPVVSSVVAARVAGDHEFSFAADKATGYFLAGTVNGSQQVFDLDAGVGTNKAQKLDQDLKANDLFGYYKVTKGVSGYMSNFQYYGWETFKDQQYYLERDAGSELFKVRVSGIYDIYINEGYKLWMDCDSADDITLYFSPSSEWETASPRFAVHYNDNDSFHLLTYDSTKACYKLENYNFVDHPNICFTRHKPGSDALGWKTDGDGGNFWSQTGDYTFGNDSPLKIKFTGSGWSGGSWSTL